MGVEQDRDKVMDFCDKEKTMEENKKKENTEDGHGHGHGHGQGQGNLEEGAQGGKRSYSEPSLMYGPIDWAGIGKKQRTQTENGGDDSEKASEEVPKKKSGKIKRRGKKKGKRT